MDIKKLNITLGITAIMLSIILFTALYVNVLKPAYYSVQGNCVINGKEILQDAGYEVVGQFSYSNNTTSTQIFVQDPIVVKHENCHYQQFLERRLFNCNIKFLNYINEVECYIRQYL